MRKSLASILVASTILSACTMIPSYERPQFSASTSWQNVPGYEMPVGETLASDLEWKKFFELSGRVSRIGWSWKYTHANC